METCSKCNGYTTVRYDSIWFEGKLREWLVIECERCGYRCNRPTKDNTKIRDLKQKETP